jgi:hypothetical protein
MSAPEPGQTLQGLRERVAELVAKMELEQDREKRGLSMGEGRHR